MFTAVTFQDTDNLSYCEPQSKWAGGRKLGDSALKRVQHNTSRLENVRSLDDMIQIVAPVCK